MYRKKKCAYESIVFAFTLKQEFCKNNCIDLLTISYWDFSRKEDIIYSHLKKYKLSKGETNYGFTIEESGT